MRLWKRPAPGPPPGLSITHTGGELLHAVPPEVAAELRFAVARLQVEDKTGVPPKLAITSSLSGEGVSFVCRSLAAVLVHDHLERKVCIVDLNWWSPGPVTLGIPGIAQAISGEKSIDEVVTPTGNPRLWYAPAGPAAPDDRPALASSGKLLDILDQLTVHVDHVLIDLPPVLATSDALTLATYATASLLVVQQGVTPVSDVMTAVDRLRGLSLLGVIMNRSTSSIPRFVRRRLADTAAPQTTQSVG